MGSKIAGRIVDVAIECFARSGYSGATTKEISTKANVTEGSLFRLFQSKEKLFDAALTASFEGGRLSNADLVNMLEGDQDFERALTKAMLAFFDKIDGRYIRIAVFGILERPELARGYFVNPSHSVTRAVARVIEREIYRGKLRDDIDPTCAALQLVSALWHVAFVSPILGSDFRVGSRASRHETVKIFVEIWFRGMEHGIPTKGKKGRNK